MRLMNRWPSRTAALAVIMALLVVSVAPVSAAGTNVGVGSEHDTASDFEAGTLSGLSISGTGDDASISLASTELIDSFEDGDLSEYSISGDAPEDPYITNQIATDGSRSLRFQYSTDDVSKAAFAPSGVDGKTFDNGEVATVNVNPGTIHDRSFHVSFGVQDPDNRYQVSYTEWRNELTLTQISGGSGTTLDSTSLGLSGNEWYEYEIDRTGSTTTITLSDSSGSELATLSTGNTDYDDYGGIGFGLYNGLGASTSDGVSFDEFRVVSESTSGTYLSDSHFVDEPTDGHVDLPTLSNADATVTWQAYSGGSWSNVTTSTYSTSGTKTADLSGTSASEYRVRVHFEKTGSNPTVSLDRDAVYFENDAPTVSNPSPSGGEISRFSDVTLSVDVSDAQFGSSQGETVTAEFFVDGAKVGESAASAAGSVSFTPTGLSDGNHSWHVVLTDSYGGTTTSSTWSFEIAHEEPSADDASADPSGGETLHTTEPQLSISVADPDFPRDGDTVTAEFFVDGSSVGTDTISSNGTAAYTPTGLSDGNHSWHVELSDTYGYTSSSGSFSFAISHYDPNISGLSPPDNTSLSSRDITLSANLTDSDFAFEGDELTAEFFVNNESAGTDTLTSNGTASFNFAGAVGGENTVFVRVTDQYGQTVQSQTNTFSVPSNLTIYNESSPTQKLTNLSEPVTLRFYYENGSQGQVIERTTSNGTISLEGLPVDQSFVVVADAPGYLPRRIFVGSLLERQSIYLLNESTEHVDNLITLSDYSGEFDKSETVLIVQRSLNGSWETVQGDYFGATGEYSAQLAYNVRHRLILRNTRTGQEKVVGSYTPLASGTKSIQVMQDGDVQLALDAPRIVFDPSVRSLSAVSNTQVITSVENQSSELTSWSVEVVYRNSTTEERLFMTNSTSATGGTISPSLDLSGRAGGNVTVIVNWTSSAGESGSKTETFFVRESFTNEYGLLPVLGQVDSMVPDPNLSVFTTFLSVIVSVLVATGVARAFPASTELVGVSAVGTLAFFSIIEWVGIPIVFVSGMSLIAFAALRRGL